MQKLTNYMENNSKGYLVLIFISIVFLIFSITIYIKNSPISKSTSPAEINEEICKTLSFENDNSINIVFLSSEEKALKYKDFFLKTEPFSEHKNSFNFYLYEIDPECETYKGIALYCANKKNILYASNCPNDLTIAIPEGAAYNLRSSADGTFSSINPSHPLTVLTHEIGHALGNLAEEYFPASLARGSKNCKTKCEKFEGKEDSCNLGCSRENYLRSINNGVMRTLQNNNYGNYNKLLLEEIIKREGSQITGKAIRDVNNKPDSFFYLLKITNGKTTEAYKFPGHASTKDFNVGTDGYKLSSKETEIFSKSENNLQIFTDGLLPDDTLIGEIYTPESYYLTVPATQATELKVIENNKVTDTMELQNIGYGACEI